MADWQVAWAAGWKGCEKGAAFAALSAHDLVQRSMAFIWRNGSFKMDVCDHDMCRCRFPIWIQENSEGLQGALVAAANYTSNKRGEVRASTISGWNGAGEGVDFLGGGLVVLNLWEVHARFQSMSVLMWGQVHINKLLTFCAASFPIACV